MSKSSIEHLLPKHVKKLKNEWKGPKYLSPNYLRLDRHESPFGSIGLDKDYSQYPEIENLNLKHQLGLRQNLPINCISLGLGTHDLIKTCLMAFCAQGKDLVMSYTPCENKIRHACASLGLNLHEQTLNKYFQIPELEFKNDGAETLKLLYLSNPNGITGTSLRIFDLIDLLDHFPGIVVIDESLIDFSHNKSLVEYVQTYKNLIVLQSFSQAWGLAGLRLAVAYACPEITEVLTLVQGPFSLPSPSVQLALQSLNFSQEKETKLQILLEQREWLKKQLIYLPFVQEVLDSDACFLMVRFQKHQLVYDYLLKEGILVADVHEEWHCGQALRISIGKAEDNERLLRALVDLPRKTSPTRRLLDGFSKSLRKAGVFLGFFKKIFN